MDLKGDAHSSIVERDWTRIVVGNHGQGRRLVRQRVGLLLPRAPTDRASSSREKL